MNEYDSACAVRALGEPIQDQTIASSPESESDQALGSINGSRSKVSRVDAVSVLRSILVVDDSASQRRLLAMTLRKRGYHVEEAVSGIEALKLASNTTFDLVISDWMMPGMNGLTLCQKLRQQQGADYLYFILLTSKNEKAEIARGLDAGADDFLVKPVNGTELDARIRAGARLVALNRQVRQQNKVANDALTELRGLYDAIDRDLTQAKMFQESLLRTRDAKIGPVRLCLTLEASGHVGGDLVGFFPINDCQLGIYALDVSGHGVSAALMTARLAGLLSGQTPGQNLAIKLDGNKQPVARDLGSVLSEMNHLMLTEMQTEHYATLFLGVLDLNRGYLDCAQAGYPPGLIRRKKGRIQALGRGGMPIGLIEQANYDAFRARLWPGDRLLLASDGITEATSPNEKMLETVGLKRWLGAAGQVPPDRLLDQLVEDTRLFTGMDRFEDDVSALVLDYLE